MEENNMNEYCPNRNSKEFKELVEIFGEDKTYLLWKRNHDSLDKAPNGADSKLFQSLLDYFEGDRKKALIAKAKTLSDDFFNWFGNWTAEDKENVSKVVDENGEPLVVYHTSSLLRSPEFDTFDTNIEGFKTAIYATDSKYASKSYLNVESAEVTHDLIYEYTPEIPFLVERLSEDYPEINWYTFDYNSLSRQMKRNKDVLRLRDLIELNEFNPEQIQHNIDKYWSEQKEFVDNAGDHLSYYYEDTDSFTKSLFLNIKKPVIIDGNGVQWNRIELTEEIINIYKKSKSYNPDLLYTWDERKEMSDAELKTEFSTREIEKMFQGSEYDGIIIQNIKDYGSHKKYMYPHDVFISYDPNQLKHIENKGTFSTTDDNIYHSLPLVYRYDSYIQPIYQKLKEQKLLTKFNGMYLVQQGKDDEYNYTRYLIEQEATANNVSVKFEERNKAVEVIFANLKPEQTDAEDLTNEKDRGRIIELISILEKAFPEYHVNRNASGRYEFISPKDIPEGVNKDANAFLKGKTIYLVRGRVTADSTVEEFLHPLINTIQQHNYQLFQQLFVEASKLFPKLKQQIYSTYTNEKGFNDYTRQNELVTQAIQRKSMSKLNKKDRASLQDLVRQMWNYIARKIQAAFTRYGDIVEVDPTKLPKMTIDELTDIISASNVRFRTGYSSKPYDSVQYNISARFKTDREIAEGITKRFDILYKAFEKIPNKSAERQQTQNRIFELYNELQEHQDISAVRIALDFALSSIGTLDENGIPTKTRSILGYLYDQSNKTEPYSDITPQILVYMYQNNIGFYDNLLNNYIPNNLNASLSQEDRVKINKLAESINVAKSMWTQAMVIVGDKIVDQQIDAEVDADNVDKENMKIVAKDWLHKNIMYGDLNLFVSYVFNYGYSPDPIIKQVFHLIQNAETKTLEEMHPIGQRVAKAYRKANKLLKNFSTNWQTILQEYDVDGIPTGNFVRPVNYGQYEKDLEQFIKDLNDEFIKTYGHTYIDDGNGVIINSLTKELADDEEWVDDEEPVYVKYLKCIEQFKCERANRRYTLKYYEERLSKPYRGSLDPNEVNTNKFGHGLSPKTLSRYNHIQSNINYYLDKCTDQKTGLSYPERLNDQDKKSLDAWRDALDKLSNPYNEDLTPKTDGELQMAFEIRAWQKWLGEKLQTTVDLDEYTNELTKLEDEARITGNWKLVQDFIKYNSRIGINPDFLNQTIGKFTKSHPQNQDVIHAQYLKQVLQSMVKTAKDYTRDLSLMENKPEFWLRCKKIDQIIEDGKSPSSADFVKELTDNFSFDQILYRDAYGRAIDSTGNPVKPEDEGVHNDLLTYQQYLINKYTNDALNSPTRTILGLVDNNGNPIVFNGTADQVEYTMVKLFSYRRQTINDDGTITEDYVPLTIFSMMMPTEDSFYNIRTGKKERTLLQVPTGRFAERQDTHGTYINKYDLNAEQPKVDYIDPEGRNRYDNSEAWKKITQDDSIKDLYDILIKTMQDAQNNYSTKNRRFNYRLPQINADSMQLMSRLIQNGFKNTAKSLFDSITTVEENDESMRTAEDYITGPDGSIATDVPLKYVRKLKDPSRLTTDVVGSVILFANMAINYKNKTEIDAQLKTLRYNLDPNFRRNVELQQGEFQPGDNEKQLSMFDSMMNKHMYNNQWATKPQEGPNSRATVAWNKAMRKVHRLETTQMLGLNLFSMLVGFGDSSVRIIKESIMGKYMTPIDSLTALADCIIHTPQILMNIGNPVANNKITRAMQLNGISKGVHQTFEHTNYGRGRKVLYNIIMGGFSLLDWMANSLLLRSFYNNIRLYDDGVVETGFYSLYELEQAFVNAGHSKKEAILAHTMSTKTLWGAYDNNMQLKPEFSDETNPNFVCHVSQKTKTRVRTKTLQRSALYNGMNPDNDQPRYKQSLVGNFIGAMRGWLTQAIQHLFAGGSDNIVREIKDIEIPEVKGTKTKVKSKHIVEPLTDEQRARRMSWNYETGTPNDQIYVGLWRSFQTLGRILNRCAHLRFAEAKNAKFSYVERYAWRDALVYMGILAACMLAWPMLNEQAAAVPPPTDRKEAGPTDLSDIDDWFVNQYIGDQYWKMQASDIGFRVIEAQITSIDPTSATDVLNSITTLNSGLDDHIGILKAASDLTGFSGHTLDEEVKQGGYKYYTRGERAFYKALGPLDNLHTAFSYWGIKKNQEFYTNTYGGIYRWFGYDFKHEKSTGSDFGFESFGKESFGSESFGAEEFN